MSDDFEFEVTTDDTPRKNWYVNLSPEMSMSEVIQFLSGLRIVFSGTDEEFRQNVPRGIARWMVERK